MIRATYYPLSFFQKGSTILTSNNIHEFCSSWSFFNGNYALGGAFGQVVLSWPHICETHLCCCTCINSCIFPARPPLYEYTTLCPFCCWWTLVYFFLVFGYNKWNHCKHSYVCFLMYICLHFLGVYLRKKFLGHWVCVMLQFSRYYVRIFHGGCADVH